MSNNDSFEVVEHYGVPSLHVVVDRSLRYEEGHEDLGIEHAFFPLDKVQAYLRERGFKAKETRDLATAIMQRANSVLKAVETATESDWNALLAGGLEDILNMCQSQFPQVQAEEEKT